MSSSVTRNSLGTYRPLPPASPVEGLAIYLSGSMVNEAQQKQKLNKALAISQLCFEMIIPICEVADTYLELFFLPATKKKWSPSTRIIQKR